MTIKRRIEALEVAHHRRHIQQALQRAGPHITFEQLLDHAIAWLEKPRAQQRTDMPNYTEAERREMNSWLPALRRARWARR